MNKLKFRIEPIIVVLSKKNKVGYQVQILQDNEWEPLYNGSKPYFFTSVNTAKKFLESVKKSITECILTLEGGTICQDH